VSMTFDPDFKVTVYLQVKYLAEDASFQLCNAVVDHQGLYRKSGEKIGIVTEIFCQNGRKVFFINDRHFSLTHLLPIETSMQIYSLTARKVLAITMDA